MKRSWPLIRTIGVMTLTAVILAVLLTQVPSEAALVQIGGLMAASAYVTALIAWVTSDSERL
jgi:hypothetical protein